MESSRFPTPGSDLPNWFNPLDPVMLAAAAGSVCGTPSVLDPSAALHPAATNRFAPLVYQHFLHQIPASRNQPHIDLLTYHAAALHQHLAVIAANRTFQHGQSLPSANRMTPSTQMISAAAASNDGSTKKEKSAGTGYTVAHLLADHHQSSINDRMNTTLSSENSGN